jgi:hypothetical protein
MNMLRSLAEESSKRTRYMLPDWPTVFIVVIFAILIGPSYAEVLLSQTFNGSNPWPQMTPYTNRPGVQATATLDSSGTIDPPVDSPSQDALLTVNTDSAASSWTAGLASGRIAILNQETNLGKLTLSFDLWASEPKPVRLRIQSFQTATITSPTGALEAEVVPTVAGAFSRYSLDLSAMTVSGPGAFDPLDPYIQIQIEIDNQTGYDRWEQPTRAIIRLDNVSYTAPSFYVKQAGSDANDGRSENTPYATIQKAIDNAQAGDVILIANGNYTGGQLATIRKAGTPAQWIVLRAYPGHSPVLKTNAWQAIYLDPASSYIEIRELSVRGSRADVTLDQALADYNASTPNPL